jgi:carbamoylphosphate synthase small subunit
MNNDIRTAAIESALAGIHARAKANREASTKKKRQVSKPITEWSEEQLRSGLEKVAYAQPFVERKDRLTVQDRVEITDYRMKTQIINELKRREHGTV